MIGEQWKSGCLKESVGTDDDDGAVVFAGKHVMGARQLTSFWSC